MSEDISALEKSLKTLATRLLEATSQGVVQAKLICREVAQDLLQLADPAGVFASRVKRQPENPFNHIVDMMANPENIILCQGVPPEDCWPLHSISFSVKEPSGLQTVEVDQAATHSAQRYPLFARPELMKILRAHTERVLKPASDWDIAVSAGSMSALDHTVAMFLNPGDTILMEEFTFLAMVDACMAAGLHMVPVKCDDDGILPSELAKVIAGAKVLYTVPVGQNPLGTRMSCERYKAIYELCAAHDVIIVEDDAYYYLQHNSHDEKADEEVSAVAGLELGPSFISIDQKGLVFRLDTVSKMLSPGFRLGWVTGPKHFIKAFEQVCYISCQMGCSMSIVCLGKLLAHWNTEGLEAQMKRVQMCLRLRCRSLLRACEAHLKGLAQWSRPQAGMFLWLRMLRSRRFTLEELLESMARHKIVPMPGGFCSPVRTGEALPYFRLSYVISPEKYDMGLQRFRQVLLDLSLPQTDGYSRDKT